MLFKSVMHDACDVLTLQNGNGEIDPEEMEDIFTKLCKAGQPRTY
jgi:hypothetical protein